MNGASSEAWAECVKDQGNYRPLRPAATENFRLGWLLAPGQNWTHKPDSHSLSSSTRGEPPWALR